MGTWRNTTLMLGLSAVAASAYAQGMAPAPTLPPPSAPVAPPAAAPVEVPVVTPSGAPIASPAQSGPVINRPRLEKPSRAGSVELTWLGHAAWVVRSPSGATILIDPWLSNPRAPQDFVMPETVDAILITHGHPDHLGQAVELSKKLHAPVIGSYELIEHLSHFGVTNGIHTNVGGTTHIKDLNIHAVSAVHSSSMDMPMPMGGPEHGAGHAASCACHKDGMPTDAIKAVAQAAAKEVIDSKLPAKGKKALGKKGKAEPAAEPAAPAEPVHQCTCPPHHDMAPPAHSHLMYAGAAMGYVIEMEGGPTLYHAGDTDLFGDMKLIAERFHPEIGLLPIGGTFTMDPKAAAWASLMLGLEEVLPMHYGTMAQLTGTPDALKDALNESKQKKKPRVVAPNPGERVSYLHKK